jgi:CheY-like chemotaxis protein
MTAPGRVLVVDDNQMNRALLRERLVRQALYVEEADDGHDALRKLAAKPFDLVLLDVMMPGLDGFDTLR